MKKLYLSWGFGCLCIVLCLFEFMTLMHIPGMQKGFTLKITTHQVLANKVQKNTPVWNAGLRDGDILLSVNGFSDIQIQRLRAKGSVSGFVNGRNQIFTTTNGVNLVLKNGTHISVPFVNQSFLIAFRTTPLWNIVGFVLALFFVMLGFCYCYSIYKYNLLQSDRNQKKYISPILFYLLGIISASYRIPFCADSFYSKMAVITFDIATIFFCLIILFVVSKIVSKDNFARKIIIKFLSFIVLVLFSVKYIFIAANFIQYDTYPYAFFYIIAYAITTLFSFFLVIYGYVHSGILYSEIGDWLVPEEIVKIDFDGLESIVLSKKTMKDIFDYVNVWIMQTFDASFAAYIALDSERKVIESFFKEETPSTTTFLAMVDERLNLEDGLLTKIHKNGGISVELKEDTLTLGYLFIGNSNKPYNAGQLKIFGPLKRIIIKAFAALEVEKAKQQKDRLKYAFSRYISPELVNNIMLSSDNVDLSGEKKILSVVFTDLQGFTDLSEELDPDVLIRVLNTYLTEMSEVIIALGGTIDKFEGDAILAFFGAPNSLSDHAVRCCRAALGMQKMEKIISDQLILKGLIQKPLHTRMGVNTGEMIVGNIGSIKRLDYTIIGRNVNIAARLETANKDFDTQILITEETWNIVKETFDARRIAQVILKGIHHKVTLYELLKEKVPAKIISAKAQAHFSTSEIATLEEI